MKMEHVEESFLQKASPFIFLLALFGIPGAGAVALIGLLQIPRLIDGRADPLFALAEIGSLVTMLVLLFLLRSCLELPSAPRGLYRNVLDFLAMAGWHPAVKVALVGLLLPPAWFFRSDPRLVPMFRLMGWRALRSGDVQDALDGLAVFWQLALTGGVPLLFGLHMLSRWMPKRRILPWLLLPLLFVGAAIAAVIIVASNMH